MIYILRDILNSHRQTPRQRVQLAERPKLSGSALSSQGAAVGARPFAVVVRSPAGPPRLILTGRLFCRCVCRDMMNETHTAWLGNFGTRTRTCRFSKAWKPTTPPWQGQWTNEVFENAAETLEGRCGESGAASWSGHHCARQVGGLHAACCEICKKMRLSGRTAAPPGERCPQMHPPHQTDEVQRSSQEGFSLSQSRRHPEHTPGVHRLKTTFMTRSRNSWKKRGRSHRAMTAATGINQFLVFVVHIINFDRLIQVRTHTHTPPTFARSTAQLNLAKFSSCDQLCHDTPSLAPSSEF